MAKVHEDQARVLLSKKKLLAAAEKTLGVVSATCKLAGVQRSTFYRYYSDDPEFKAAIDDISNNVALDFAESALFKNIKDGDVSSTIFFLKCKGKKRGYVEKISTDVTMAITDFRVGYSSEENDE